MTRATRGVAPPRRGLVIPMHEEAGRIGVTIEVLSASWLSTEDTEIIFVDDGSNDGTPDVVEKKLAAAGLIGRVLCLPSNQGKGAAVRRGILASQADVVGFVDADLSTGVDDIQRVFAAVENGDADVAFGSRTHGASDISIHQPWFRQFSGKFFNVALRAMGLTSYRDTQCGLKVFTQDAATAIFTDLRTTGFAFDVEVLARADRLGHRLEEVPINWRHVEASSVSATSDGVRMLRDSIRIRRSLRSAEPNGQKLKMARGAFDAMAKVERTHWWFIAKRALVMEAVEAYDPPRRRLLDVGSGSGALLEHLRTHFGMVIGSEFDEHAIALASRAHGALVRGLAENLPMRSASMSVVTCLDVVEHLDDDAAGLCELRRSTEPGGLIVIAVPAYQWAWSEHDERLGHRRRYTRAQLRRVLKGADLQLLRITYFHSWLVLPAFFLRKTPLRRLLRRPAEEASYVSPRVNRLLTTLVALERRVLRRRDLPFGLSILAVARVPEGPRTS